MHQGSSLHPLETVRTALSRWRAWWARLSPSKQDRFAVLAPLVTIGLFVLVVFASISYLRYEEAQREREAAQRDLLYAQTQLRERLTERKEQVLQLAKDIGRGLMDPATFITQAETLLATSPEILTLVWVDADKRSRTAYVSTSAYTMSWAQKNDIKSHSTASALFDEVRKDRHPAYSAPYVLDDQRGLIQLQAPIMNPSLTRFSGVVMAEISLDSLLQHGIPLDLHTKYGTAFLASDGMRWAGELNPKQTFAGEGSNWHWLSGILGVHREQTARGDFEVNEVERTPDEGDAALQLALRSYTSSQGFTGTGLRLLVMFLTALTIWMLWANWRHTRRRLKAQRDLQAEINFRRAMEGSMPTGMRALDLQGRITYVNAAFCQMTLWQESELVGSLPPYVYWPKNELVRLGEVLTHELKGTANPLGEELKVLRKDGTQFDARMYISPLIDAQGKQTGWMTSMTDITEPRRIRDELTAAFDRFATILEGMDASISVSTLGSKQLLFANKTYRDWFGSQSRTQPEFVDTLLMQEAGERTLDYGEDVDALAGLPLADVEDAPSESQEVYVETLGKWLEVRVRYLNWVDGHLAQMVIGSDITERKTAEQRTQEQFEKAQAASRLMTMGEMASSVAHELNQPLAAIANYCAGMKARLTQGSFDQEEFAKAVDKAHAQAQRAGQIIHRIRNFVKKSEPNRTPSDVAAMVGEAMELAGIEVRRRRVHLVQHIAERLPLLPVDPILIEQVLVNLIKNAAEAVDLAQKPPTERMITLSVVPKLHSGEAGVQFTVEDSGPGIAEEKLDKIFDAFFSTKAEGMGMGLNLCRTIVESHLGRLTAQNLYNGKVVVGCAFSFWLPLTAMLTSDSSAKT